MLDDLVGIIETIQERISKYETFLSGHETRTRTALIDPLLTALGWNTADPKIVRPEYNIGSSANSGRVDYGLLGQGGQLVASIEAKRLGESLENHEKQLFDYAWNLKVKYAGLTDGNRWYFLDSSKVTSSNPLMLELKLSDASAHEVALKLLLLWHPNLASGQPVPASSPVFVDLSLGNESVVPNPPQPPPAPLPQREWIPLPNVVAGKNQQSPSAIRLSSGQGRQIKSWREILVEVARKLSDDGLLRAVDCPIAGMGFINSSPKGPGGGPFRNYKLVSGGLYVNVGLNANSIVKYSQKLLSHFNVDPATVEIRFQ